MIRRTSEISNFVKENKLHVEIDYITDDDNNIVFSFQCWCFSISDDECIIGDKIINYQSLITPNDDEILNLLKTVVREKKLNNILL
jgi:hypothetical protein